MKPVLKWGAVGCCSLLFVCTLGFAFLVALEIRNPGSISGKATPAATVVALAANPTQPPTVAPTATQAPPPPTQPPAPTARPTEPPAPTAGPPTATVRAARATATTSPKPAGPSPEALAYLDWLQPRMQLVGESATQVGSLLGQFGERQTLLFDKEWQTKIGVQLGLMKGAGEQMRSGARHVPPEARALDDNVKSLGGDTVAAAEAYAEGLTKLDAQAFTRGQQRLTTGRATINRMMPQIDALKAGR